MDKPLDINCEYFDDKYNIEAEWLIYASVNKDIIGSDNGLSSAQCQAFICILLEIESLGPNLSDNLIKMQHFS